MPKPSKSKKTVANRIRRDALSGVAADAACLDGCEVGIGIYVGVRDEEIAWRRHSQANARLVTTLLSADRATAARAQMYGGARGHEELYGCALGDR
jgi:hypothetical protein